jgi:hypothetical protein
MISSRTISHQKHHRSAGCACVLIRPSQSKIAPDVTKLESSVLATVNTVDDLNIWINYFSHRRRVPGPVELLKLSAQLKAIPHQVVD